MSRSCSRSSPAAGRSSSSGSPRAASTSARRSTANVFFDTASYGRRALELCIETFGVEQLVFGTDTPVVDPTPAIRAVDAFGESVAGSSVRTT